MHSGELTPVEEVQYGLVTDVLPGLVEAEAQLHSDESADVRVIHVELLNLIWQTKQLIQTIQSPRFKKAEVVS